MDLARFVNILSRPTLTAFEALIQHLIMVDPSFGLFLRRMEPMWMDNFQDLSVFPKEKPNGLLTESVFQAQKPTHLALYQLLKSFKEVHRAQLRPSLEPRRDANAWAKRIFETIEQRSQEITAALRKVLEKEKRPKN